MGLLRSAPLHPVPLPPLLLAVAALWAAPVLIGLFGLAMYMVIGRTWADLGLGVWFAANALTFSPLFSWIGWLLALPPVWAALRLGWFGWLPALAIGAAAGAIAGEMAQTEIALPFGIVALVMLRAVLGRVFPL
jgi:hypothetical protein